MASSLANYYDVVLLRTLPLTILIFSVTFVFTLAHENNNNIDSNSHSHQQALFRQAAPTQKANDEKVEILHPPTSGNNSDLNTRFYSGEYNNKHQGSADYSYFNQGLTNHNFYQQQQNPVFVPSYYGSSGTSYGQRPPIPFPQSHYSQNHPLLGNKFSPQRFPLLEQFSNSLIPPKHYFPFNPSPPIDPSLLDYYPSHHHHSSHFHEREPYPSYPSYLGSSNYGSSFHLGLPKQVKVPGRIEISLSGNDAEITCEFPKYLILIQKIYWHHKYDDPYGSYYDENNGFGPRIRVMSSDQWRSVLQIRDFSEDDYGPYRCISAAVLPEEGGGATNRNLFLNEKQVSTTAATVNSPAVYTEHPYPFDEEENSKKSKSVKQKSRNFPISRKIRFVRDTQTANKQEEPKKQSFPKVERSSESNLIASPEIYDPFSRPHGPGLYNHPEEGFPYTNFPNPNKNYIPSAHVTPNYFSTVGSTTKLPFSLPNNNQHSYNYNPAPVPYHPHHYSHGLGKYTNINYGPPSSYGLHAPYYKPKYSIFTVYQEINFAPLDYKPTVNPVGK